MGLFDSLFGKKATIQTTDGQGRSIERAVSEKQLKRWESEGKISMVETIKVHVLDPKGSYTTRWQIGREVPAEVVSKAKDPSSGDLHAVTVYEAGEARTVVVVKAKWLQVKEAMGE